MTFLKKLGQLLATATATLMGIGPLITPLFGSGKGAQLVQTGINDFTAIGSVVVQIELALAGKTGADKFVAAVALVGPIIRTSQIVTGKKIANEALFQKGVEECTQGLVDVLNSIHSDSAK